MKLIQLILISILSMINFNLQADPPEELGKVEWLRDFEQGLKQSAATDKPIFLLFQEVPGCMTCQRYGSQVLSHPLIVDAIEELFIPVAVYNNKGGKDAEVLKYYEEPSWNNPVVRIVDENRLDIMPRLSGAYTPLGVVQHMIFALERRQIAVPVYLQLLYEELQSEQTGTEKATLSMYCFWTGEKQLGQIDGVLSTEAGFMDGREVVQLTYDPSLISFEDLVEQGMEVRCADNIYTHTEQQQKSASKVLSKGQIRQASSFRPDRAPKYYLSHTFYRAVPMTALQAARANALVGSGKSPETVLSPGQIRWANQMKNKKSSDWPNRIGEDIVSAWKW